MHSPATTPEGSRSGSILAIGCFGLERLIHRVPPHPARRQRWPGRSPSVGLPRHPDAGAGSVTRNTANQLLTLGISRVITGVAPLTNPIRYCPPIFEGSFEIAPTTSVAVLICGTGFRPRGEWAFLSSTQNRPLPASHRWRKTCLQVSSAGK
jgi:hypothetical protein